MTQTTQNKFFIDDDAVYKEVNKGLYTTYEKQSVGTKKCVPSWTGPKIPWDLWRELIAWCEVTQEKFKSEALALLFLSDDQEWKVWYPPQTTQGMTVQADEKHADYAIQRAKMPDMQLGTLHHHCTAGAFASGTDEKDEIDRDGLHFTVGSLDEARYTLHYRFCIEGACHEGKAHEVIEMSPDIDLVPAKYKDSLHSQMCSDPTASNITWDFTEELKNVTKKVYVAQNWNRGRFGNNRMHHGIGYGSGETYTSAHEEYLMEQAIQKQAEEAEADNYIFVADVAADADLLYNHVSHAFTSLDELLDKWFGWVSGYTDTDEDIVNMHAVLKGERYAEGSLDTKARNIQYKVAQELYAEIDDDMPKKYIYKNSEMLHKHLLEVFEQYNQDNDINEDGSPTKPTSDEALTASEDPIPTS